MNDKNKTNKVINIMLGLTGFSTLLFVYDNIYLEKMNKPIPIYVAKEKIPTGTKITEDMLELKLMPKDGMDEMYITENEKDKLIGNELSGSLLKGEIIQENRITSEDDKSAFLEVKLTLDEASMPIDTNDFVNIYVSGTKNGDIKIQKVLEQKKVVKKTFTNENDGSKISYISLNLTEEEAVKYLKAREFGKIIAVKNNNVDITKSNAKVENFDESNNGQIEEFNPESANYNLDKNTGNENMGIINTTFKEGDTLDQLAIKYKTTVAKIIELNQGKQNFEIGEVIVVPAI